MACNKEIVMADDKYIFGVLGALLVLIVTLILTGALLLATTIDALADVDCQARAEESTNFWFGYPSNDWSYAADIKRRKKIMQASGEEWDPSEIRHLYLDMCEGHKSHFVARTASRISSSTN